MKFEVLKKNNLKRNIVIGVFVVLIISAIILNFSSARYRSTASVPIVNSTVNYTRPDLNVVAMYQKNESGEYVSIDTVPTSGYSLNKDDSYCKVGDEIDSSIPISYESGRVNISINKKGTKCYLYFDEANLLVDVLKSYNQRTRTDFSTIYFETLSNTIFTAEDNDGTTYYFAGNPTDNWVYFAGFYWRIIRVNGDNSIRLIYSGSDLTGAVTIGDGTRVDTSLFAISSSSNDYLGYMYNNNTQDSYAKVAVDEWFSTYFPTQYYDYLSDSGFCGDRNYEITGDTMYYDNYTRITNFTPTFKCANENDLYTTNTASKGNKSLTYPVGLISSDEVVFAGGNLATNNTSYYLYTGGAYWTISPGGASQYGTGAHMLYVNGNGGISRGVAESGDRPVINLRSDVTVASGNGTQNSPFVLSEL